MEIVGNDAQFNGKVTLLKDLEIYGDIKNKTKDTSLDFSDNLSFKIQGNEKLRITSDSTTFTDTVTAPKFSGPFEGTTGNFSGDVIIGGTLTYEDVTNVDSVGLITARSGIVATGIVTATSFSGVGAFVSGMIILWSGAADAIPSGFVLCNGSNGTPDLRGRFVVGYSDTDGDYDVNDTGGSKDNTLSVSQLPSHNHSFSGSASHNHTHTKATHPSGSGPEQNQSGGPEDRTNFGDTGTTSTATVTISGTTGDTGSGSAIENRPPYYALCYIMKT
jgi:microcystin-dependent protein